MIGQTISHYKIIEKLGEGGMGEVFLAEDTKLKRKVALKFLPKEFTNVGANGNSPKERFFREARAAAALNHPNIVTIHEINEYEDQTYIAMEYVEGQTLKELITGVGAGLAPARATARVAPTIKEIINITTQICEGLSKAHEAGIIHRDIKPQNILIDKDGRVKILDFGLAKLRVEANGYSPSITKIGTTMGTTNYMSPEQAMGKEIDHRTDIWSLGVILYEMITGQLPFKGDYEQAVIYSIINEDPESLLNIKPKLPAELNQIIIKTMEKNPRQRYQNIDEIKTDLHALNLIRKPNHPIKEKNMDKSKKSRKTLTIGLLVLTLIVIFCVGYILLNRSKGTARVIDSLAVLPLENLSGDPNQEYFSDGMTEALITELSRIKALKVISRTSVMRFKNTRKSLPEIAWQLNVAAVVEGSVLRAGDKVRITAQLIEAESDKHLWAESYERDLRDILSLQKEVAKTIARQIKITLTPAEKDTLSKETSINPIAHEAYLKSIHFLNQITVKGARQALEYFDRVIEMEPEFAPAYTGKAKAYDVIVSLGALSSKQGWFLVREWAEKALKIDKNNADAHMLIADVKYLFEWDWPGAEKAFLKSIELNPNNSIAYNWYAIFLSAMGRNSEAISMSQRALELAPLSIAPYPNAIVIHIFAGLDEKAEVLFHKFRELHPRHPLSVRIQALIYLKKSRYREALQISQSQLTQEMSPAMKDETKTSIAYILARTGNTKKSREMLEYLISRSHTHYVSSFKIALIYMALDENDEAFVWLEKAYHERCDELPKLLKTAPILNELRPDPRFQDLLKRMKLDK